MVQNRFKSVVVWTALVSLVLNVLVQCGVILQDQSSAISGALSGILNCLVVFGILNNPKDPQNF